MKTGLDLRAEESAVVMLSGGPDSAVIQAHCNRNYDEVINVHVSFGQQMSETEIQRVRELNSHYDNELLIFDNSDVATQVNSIPYILDAEDRSDEIESQSLDYYPMRSINMLMYGGQVADMAGADHLHVGFFDGIGNTPDTNAEVIVGLEHAMNESTSHDFQICLPFAGHSRGEVIQYGESIDTPWELTYSCYKESDPENPVHCGECYACEQRAEKFLEAGVEDPVEYDAAIDL